MPRSRSVVAQGFSPASAALKGCATLVLTAAALAIGGAQSFEKRAVDSWPTYHGDYSGQRHSPLTQITPANVSQLTLAWAFQTGQSASIKSTPIVVNGMLYVSAPDQLWAIDARTARQVWQYRYPDNTGFHIGHRGVAVYKDSVFLTTPDAHLVALDARNGKVKWNVEIADAKKGYWSTNAPLLIRNHLLVGVAGDFDNLPGILTSVDPETGKTQWVYYSTPPPGTPGSTSGGATGGQMWMTGTYDPQLDLVYVGTGNPTPVLNGDARPGDNTWTNSIVALHPETGRMEWGFQTTPHDTHDWDASEVPVLVDGLFDGVPRKMILQAARNGYFFVLDRANGTNLKTIPFAAANWATGVDKAGRPIPNRDKEPSRDGRLVAPNEAGGTNYRSPSFDPGTGLFIVSAQDSYGIYFYKAEHGNYGWAGADYNVYGRGVLRAIDYRTGAVRWSHELGDGAAPAGVLTTASGLVFTGDNSGNALALRTSDGATLWHASIGTVGNAPITYELDGRQYVVMGGGGVLFGFALPAGAPQSAPQPALNAERLTGKNVAISQTTFQGRSATQVIATPDAPNAGSYAVVKDVSFRDGAIEVDLAGQPAAFAAGTAARGFIGIAFRLQADGSYEYIYLRPTNGRADDQVRRNHSTQYSAHPIFDFAKSRQEAPEKYESYVDLEPGVWTTYKIEVSGRSARLFVHGAEQPCLIVNDLKLEPREGGVALWVGPGTEGYFSNLKITAK